MKKYIHYTSISKYVESAVVQVLNTLTSNITTLQQITQFNVYSIMNKQKKQQGMLLYFYYNN